MRDRSARGKRRLGATDPPLANEVSQGAPGVVPVVGIEVLVLMKLRAGRSQDVADVEALVRAGADLAAILIYLRRHEPQRVPAFSSCAQRALKEQ